MEAKRGPEGLCYPVGGDNSKRWDPDFDLSRGSSKEIDLKIGGDEVKPSKAILRWAEEVDWTRIDCTLFRRESSIKGASLRDSALLIVRDA